MSQLAPTRPTSALKIFLRYSLSFPIWHIFYCFFLPTFWGHIILLHLVLKMKLELKLVKVTKLVHNCCLLNTKRQPKPHIEGRPRIKRSPHPDLLMLLYAWCICYHRYIRVQPLAGLMYQPNQPLDIISCIPDPAAKGGKQQQQQCQVNNNKGKGGKQQQHCQVNNNKMKTTAF